MRSTGSRLIARPNTFMATPRRRLPWWTGMAAQIVGALLLVGLVVLLAGVVAINGQSVP